MMRIRANQREMVAAGLLTGLAVTVSSFRDELQVPYGKVLMLDFHHIRLYGISFADTLTNLYHDLLSFSFRAIKFKTTKIIFS